MPTLTRNLTDQDLQTILLLGRVQHEEREWVALPQRIRGDQLEIELTTPEQIAKPSALVRWFMAIRAVSLTATVMPCLTVLAFGAWTGAHIDIGNAALAIAGVLLLQVAVNLFNDVEDHLRLIDLPGTMGGAGVIQRGWLRARDVRTAAWIALALGTLSGLPTFWAHPKAMLSIALLAILGTLGYSGKPFGFKYIALGDALVFLMCGPAIAVGMSFAAFHTVGWASVALGAYFGCAAVGILHANNLQDAELDVARGARTVAQHLGANQSRVYLMLVYVFAVASLFAAAQFARLPIFATAMATTLAAAACSPLVRKIGRARDLNDASYRMLRVEAAQLHLLLGIVALVSVATAHFLR